ncbi:MAG: hypothetical protein KDK65_02065, partial [Chlamydiia bacterium]|nr:hypothetical protein [Chlamydiia bacterium]
MERKRASFSAPAELQASLRSACNPAVTEKHAVGQEKAVATSCVCINTLMERMQELMLKGPDARKERRPLKGSLCMQKKAFELSKNQYLESSPSYPVHAILKSFHFSPFPCLRTPSPPSACI